MTKARRKFTHFLLLAISSVGLLSALFLLTDPPPIDLSVLSTTTLAPERNIASTDSKQVAIPEAALLIIDCTETNQILETASSRFRLKGPLCVPQDFNVISTKVSNKTNGYIATVFHQSNQFTTDYLNLREGRNEIDVRFNTDRGEVQKTITILRSFQSAKN